MTVAIPVVAVVVAAFLQWANWGLARFNWGPRLGAVLLVVFGDVAFRGTWVGEWLRRGVDLLADLLAASATAAFTPAFGDAIRALVPWLPATLLAAYWAVALSPWGKQKMTWRLAWIGVFIPALIPATPGDAGSVLSVGLDWVVTAGTWIVGWPLGWVS